MGLAKAKITHRAHRRAVRGDVQPRGVQRSTRTTTSPRRACPGSARRCCSSSTATCARWRWSCSSTPTTRAATCASETQKRRRVCSTSTPSCTRRRCCACAGRRCSSAACWRAASQKFTRFLEDGRPTRARLTVSVQRVHRPEREAKEVNRQTADFTQVARRPARRDAQRHRRRATTRTRSCGGRSRSRTGSTIRAAGGRASRCAFRRCRSPIRTR